MGKIKRKAKEETVSFHSHLASFFRFMAANLSLTQVTNWVKLKFAAMNLKKLARWLWRDTVSSFAFLLILPIYAKKPVHA